MQASIKHFTAILIIVISGYLLYSNLGSKKEVKIQDVVIYTKMGCSYCQKAKNLLRNHNIDFQEIEITFDSKKFEELQAQTGSNTVPQIFINNEFIGGYSELSALLN